jgi:hypothetical protein
MANEHPQSGHGPIGLAASNSYFSWARLASGIFAVAVSLAVSWRTASPTGELAHEQAPQPEEAPLASGVVLTNETPAPIADPTEGKTVPASTLHASAPQPVAPSRVVPARAVRPAVMHKRPTPHTNSHAKVQAATSTPKNADVDPRASHPNTLSRSIRTRTEVRDEFIASRKQVAAMTGEDSGSVYLARVAARHGAAPERQTQAAHGTRAKSTRNDGAVRQAGTLEGRQGIAAAGTAHAGTV